MKWFNFSLLSVAALAVSCATSSHNSISAISHSCCATNLATTATFTDKSLFQLDSKWTDDAGQSLALGALKGRVQVVVMFFASCTYACPIIVHDLQRIEAAFDVGMFGRIAERVKHQNRIEHRGHNARPIARRVLAFDHPTFGGGDARLTARHNAELIEQL